jgi:methionyl-tRNA synthetase
MGKDNINFHSINFPATLIGSGEPWKTVDFIKGFNWLNYNGGKFSTSSNRGVFMYQAIEILPPDYWRYYLMSRAPESSDSDFTWADFQATVNKDLADVLGNLVNRTLQFCAKKFGPTVPAAGPLTAEDNAFIANLQSAITSYTTNLDGKEFRKATQDLRAIWVLGNEYLATTAPWTVAKENPERAGHILNLVINFLRLVASLSAPVIPDTAEKIAAILNTNSPHSFWPKADSLLADLKVLAPGHAFTIPEVLFQKLDDETTAALDARFSGASKAA